MHDECHQNVIKVKRENRVKVTANPATAKVNLLCFSIHSIYQHQINEVKSPREKKKKNELKAIETTKLF